MEHDFGKVAIGAERTVIVTISNTGGHDLVLDSARFYNGGAAHFAILTLMNFPLYITPGESQEVEVAFRPTELGLVTAWVVISSNDSVNPYAYVNFSGEGVESESSF